MTETNSQTEPISELSEVVTDQGAPKLTESAVAPPIKKKPSEAKLAALEKARNSRSQKAKEKRETLLKAARPAAPAAQPAPSEPPPRTLDFYVNAHNEGLEKYPDTYKQLVTPPPIQRPMLKFV